MNAQKLAISALVLLAVTPPLRAQLPARSDAFTPELQKLVTQLRSRQAAAARESQKRPEPERQSAYTRSMKQLVAQFGPRLLALARKARGTATGLRARMQYFEIVGTINEDVSPALLKIAQEAVAVEGKNPEAVSTFGVLRYSLKKPADQQALLQLLQDIESMSPLRSIQAQALLERGQALAEFQKKPEGIALIRQVMQKYADTPAARQAESTLAEMEKK